jgi:hypothetical protein
LTLTGAVALGGDCINSPVNDHGQASKLKIHGTVAVCGEVDETCDVAWRQEDDYHGGFRRTGTV